MNNWSSLKGNSLFRESYISRLATVLILVQSVTISPDLSAGAFLFSGESNGVDVITHPIGYAGTGGTLSLGVCIDPLSENASELEIPVQNNIYVWNELQPVASNIQLNAVNGIDAESVLLHEFGHCIGLAHVNAASESGLSGSNRDFTKATDGGNDLFDINAGADGIIGSHDDLRGDDVNLHWFNPFNDPFRLPIPAPVDTTLYKRDVIYLPPGDNFAQNAARNVGAAQGYPNSEAVMQQGTYTGEIQRELVSDDASTIMLAGSGLDETAGTGDDYQIELTYQGIGTGPQCDITVIMEDLGGSLAYCSAGGAFVGNGHVRMTSASIHLGTGITYFFNTVPRGGGNGSPVAENDNANVDEDDSVDIDVLDNDSDPDNDSLSVTGVGNPTHGTTSINPDDSIRYTPDANYNGADSFSYTISDGNGGSDNATVNVTVNPVNDFPVAVDDNGGTTPPNTAILIDVLLNDSDADGDALSVAAVTDGANGTVTNNVTDVTYLPNPGFSGQDTFTYTVSDGNPGSTDNAMVTVLVDGGPANQPPTASFTSSCGGMSCSFDASGSFDPDGTIVSYSWDFGDGNGGSGSAPVHVYGSTGSFLVTLTVEDNQSATDSVSATISTTTAPDYASADWSAVQGRVTGTYEATHAADGIEQSIREVFTIIGSWVTADSLEHIWQFDLTDGNHIFNMSATAIFPTGDADSEFRFQWSSNSSGPWTDMVTLTASSSGYQTFDIGSGVTGTIYVRVIDFDATPRNRVYSEVRVDHMYFEAGTPVTSPPGQASNPNPVQGASSVPVNTTLSWTAGTGAARHDVFFGASPGSLAEVSSDQLGTSYQLVGLDPGTTYYWRVDEQNAAGTTTGLVWQFTTTTTAGPTELKVSSIDVTTVREGFFRRRGVATVNVVDDFGQAIAGVMVFGTFTGGFNETASGITDANGAASVTTTTTALRGVSFTFCVDNIDGPLPYSPDTPDCASY